MARLLIRRTAGQSIHIGRDIVVTIEEVHGGRVTVDIVAPKDVTVLRDELFYRRKPAAQPEEAKE